MAMVLMFQALLEVISLKDLYSLLKDLSNILKDIRELTEEPLLPSPGLQEHPRLSPQPSQGPQEAGRISGAS